MVTACFSTRIPFNAIVVMTDPVSRHGHGIAVSADGHKFDGGWLFLYYVDLGLCYDV